MQAERVPVAPGVELALRRWDPGRPDDTGAGDEVRTDGSAATFLLVHGLASNARLWDGVAERLAAAGHRAVAVDLRGHGRSSKPDGPYDVATVADDLAALMRTLREDGFARPILAGQSWGGNVVLDLAARHGDLVRGLVLVDGGWIDLQAAFPDWDACRAALAPPRLAGRQRAEIERRIRAAHPDWPEAGIAGTLANFEERDDGTIAPWLTFDRHIAVLHGLWEHRPAARYAAVTAATLLLPVNGGPADRARRAQELVSAALAGLPNARVRWFAGDHDIHAQRPGELADVMLDNLRLGFFE